MQKLNGINIFCEESISINQWNDLRKVYNIKGVEESNKNIKEII